VVMASIDKELNTAGPPTEVSSKAKRRTFSVKEKLRILRAADACPRGEVGALLRREGIYSSHLCDWRKARDSGELSVAAPARRGPKPGPWDPSAERIVELEKQLARAVARAEHAEALVDLQKKIAALLGKPLPDSSGRP
jgi:transposase